jgi:hypothetical protein
MILNLGLCWETPVSIDLSHGMIHYEIILTSLGTTQIYQWLVWGLLSLLKIGIKKCKLEKVSHTELQEHIYNGFYVHDGIMQNRLDYVSM